MNHGLDQVLVGLVLAASVGYALMTLGPRALRLRILSVLSRVAAGVPKSFGLSPWAQRLAAAAESKPKGACGGCDNCGSATSSTTQSAPTEIKIPVGKIGRRA
jgi:hypothetical protein